MAPIEKRQEPEREFARRGLAAPRTEASGQCSSPMVAPSAHLLTVTPDTKRSTEILESGDRHVGDQAGHYERSPVSERGSRYEAHDRCGVEQQKPLSRRDRPFPHQSCRLTDTVSGASGTSTSKSSIGGRAGGCLSCLSNRPGSTLRRSHSTSLTSSTDSFLERQADGGSQTSRAS